MCKRLDRSKAQAILIPTYRVSDSEPLEGLGAVVTLAQIIIFNSNYFLKIMPKTYGPINTLPINRIYVWFYRLLGITFDGIAFNSDEKLYIDRYLTYFGYLFAVVITSANLIAFSYFLINCYLMATHKSDEILPYSMLFLIKGLQIFEALVNRWYLNSNCFKLLEVFSQYEMAIKRNQKYILFLKILWKVISQ